MSSDKESEFSSHSSSDEDDSGIKLIYQGAGVAATIYELKRRKIEKPRRWGGSVDGRAYLHRNRIGAHNTLMRDYFDENCTYPDEYFRRRFRMNKFVFMRIHDAVVQHDPTNFLQRRDATKKLGLSSFQKNSTALRILAYGIAGDFVDDHLKVAESTALQCVKAFCTAVIEIFSDEYLRNPNQQDTERILQENAERGFPGMLGSLDCMHWKWKNCPTAHHGSHVNGKIGAPTLILEAVATRNLWIWHCFFGMAGTNNDLNVLDNSHLFDRIISGEAPTCNYVVNGNTYNMGYYLADGIYPNWATLIKTISQPVNPKQKHFAEAQEAARKDVERAFGVLQARFSIVKGSVRFWNREECGRVMKTCIIQHNMIVESEEDPNTWVPLEGESSQFVDHERQAEILQTNFVDRIKVMTNQVTHSKLKTDLIEHLWNLRGEDASIPI